MRERIRRRRLTAIVSLGGLLALIGAAIAVAATGALRQPPGPAGCVSEHGSGGCANGHGLAGGVDAVAVSPDGRSVYATTHRAIARFKRNRSTGKIRTLRRRPWDFNRRCRFGRGHSGRKERLRRFLYRQYRDSLQAQPGHGRDPGARGERRLRERGRIGAVRRRSRTFGSRLGSGERRRQERLRSVDDQ